MSSDGGVVLLGTTECYDGPIVVTYADRSVFELQEAICPGQTLLVHPGSAAIFAEPAVN